MSAEAVVKKRGRPKKVVLDPIEVQSPKPSERAKSTKTASSKASSKATKSDISAKDGAASKTFSSPTGLPKTTPTLPPASPKPEPSRPNIKTSQATPVTPETSKILSKVRDLSAKTTHTPPVSTKSASPLLDVRGPTKPTATTTKPFAPPPKTTTNTSVPRAPQPTPKPSTFAPTTQPKLSNTPASLNKASPSPQSSTPNLKSKPGIPLASLNSAVVSGISERAGARPNVAGTSQLPKNYKTVSRRITMAIVAMPIAIITSWVLYERLVLGEERKLLVPVAPPAAKLRDDPEASTT